MLHKMGQNVTNTSPGMWEGEEIPAMYVCIRISSLSLLVRGSKKNKRRIIPTKFMTAVTLSPILIPYHTHQIQNDITTHITCNCFICLLLCHRVHLSYVTEASNTRLVLSKLFSPILQTCPITCMRAFSFSSPSSSSSTS